MTDVVSHADTSPDGGRRPSRPRRAQRGMRVPAAPPVAAGAGDGARARHRRAPGTGPFVVPTATGDAPRNRHHAADPTQAFGSHTGGLAAGRSTEPRPRHRPDPAADPVTGPIATPDGATALTAVTTATSTGRHAAIEAIEAPITAAASVSAPSSVAEEAAPKRRGLPLRATIGLIGGGGVAALFALTTPGSPLPASAPNDPQPSVAAPAGLVDSVLPSAPVAAPPSSLAPVSPSEITTTTPTEEGPQPVIGALFDAASGAFDDLFDNSADDGLVEDGPRPRIVANPDDPGRQAWQFSLGPGGKRSEVLPQGPGTEPVDGDEQYIRYTAHLSDDFPTDTGNWQVILQWHHTSPNGSPPLALQVTRGQLYMVSEGDDMQAIGPVSPGQRIDLTMRVTFAQDPDEGSVTVWRDGRPTGVTNWQPRDGTMSTHAAYLKMGMYRAQAIRENGSIVVTDLKIGKTPEGIGGIGPRTVD